MITVNGDKVDYLNEETVDDLLRRMGFVFPLLVVRINNQLIERKNYVTRILEDGDSVEVLHLLSGG